MASMDVEKVSATNEIVIGLDVGGRLFYTKRSTLTSGSSYFAARFSGSFDADLSHIDETGRKVYFIDANPIVFEHILDYLRDGVVNWPSESDNSILLNRIRALADYYGIDTMIAALAPPEKFEPTTSGKGVLYWLGTKKGTQEYQNPLDICAVTLGGSCLALAQKEALLQRRGRRRDPDTYKNFVQYRPLCGIIQGWEIEENLPWDVLHEDAGAIYWTSCAVMGCGDGHTRRDLILDLKSVVVKPSHYSLRYSYCRSNRDGMRDWDFQACNDGESWVTLHQARNDSSIADLTEEKLEKMKLAIDRDEWENANATQKKSIVTSIAEQDLRQTWAADSNAFFRYFRIVGVASKNSDNKSEESCIHAVAFELFGEVKDI